MSKLKTLKSWLTLDEAAECLTEALKESVTVKALLQLALEGQLPLAWVANKAEATDYVGSDYDTIDEIRTFTSREYHCSVLNGPHRLLMSEHSGLYNFLLAALMPESDFPSFTGLFVTDSEGQTWQILDEYQYDHVTTLRPFEVSISSWHHIVVMSSDIQSLIERLKSRLKILDGDRQNSSNGLHPRERETLLTIIGALTDRMLGQTPNGREISVFKTQSAIIDDLLAHFPDQPGLSQRNLEQKFAEAKKKLDKP